ncbi:Farnesyl pyrophosphate synthase, partial [Lamellibrachia satsuma]
LQCTMQTVTGQTLDMITAPVDHVDFSSYTIERYNAIVKYKTAFYSFFLPVALAMHMAGIEDEKPYDSAKMILLKMGEFFQIQDDYIDCFGDPEVTGKVGTDIEDNKCGWLIVQALKRVSPEQRTILEENYAKKDADCVARVKAVYRDLKLLRVYSDYEENSYNELIQLIDQLDNSLPRKMFTAYAEKIYKRDK